MTENEVLIKTPEEAIETIKSNMPTSGYQMLRESLDMAIIALKEIQQYREIGTVEECREVMDKLTKAEKTLSSILSGNYNDECNFCIYNNNPMANCQCISGDGSWCIHNAKWNGKISDNENLEGMDNGA